MIFKKNNYENEMEILASDKNLVRFSGTVKDTGIIADENGKKYAKAGSLIDSDGVVVTQVNTVSAAGTAGVYTLTINTAFVDGDIITVNGIDYSCKTDADDDSEFAVGSSSTTQAAALATIIANNEKEFIVAASANKITFTQKVNGNGVIPAVICNGTGSATIASTTTGVADTFTVTLSSTPVAVLYQTVDVTNGNQPCSKIVEGYLRKDRVLDVFDSSLANTIKTALSNIKFV